MKHHRFQSASSTSAVQLAYEDETPLEEGQTDRDTTSITYGTGKLTGEYIRDKVCMGAAPGDQVCTVSDFLGVTTESRFPFIQLPFDGIFGLGLDGLSAGPNFNFVNRLVSASSLKDPMFAFFLRGLKAEEESEISLGGYREEKLNGTLHWLPVPVDDAKDKGYWLVTMRDVIVNGQKLNLCADPYDASNPTPPQCMVAMDTGSSLTMGPPREMGILLDAIGLKDDCSNVKTLPTLKFQMEAAGGEVYEMVMEPQDYAEHDTDEEGESCATGFQPMALPPSIGPMWVFGQNILRKFYSVYDPKQWRVGVGLAVHSSKVRWNPTSTPTPHAILPKEVCADDEKHMGSFMPGCKSFKQMGYCKRFPPLANHYCKLSCAFCSPPANSANKAAPEVSVKGSGIAVKSQMKAVLGHRPNAFDDFELGD